MGNMKIVVIDSGVSFNHPSIMGGFSIDQKEKIFESFEDKIGHGTAVVDIILKNSQNVEVYVINIFQDKMECSINVLSKALEYVYENIECNIIQISLGTYKSSKRLEEIINKLALKQICIISAFDNEKCISYPAAYENVIGIDVSADYKDPSLYNYIEGGIIDIQGGEIFFRTRWIKEKINVVSGSSFYCSYIVSLVSKFYLDSYSKKNVMKKLKINATSIIYEQKYKYLSKLQIKKAVIFPFNKEIHALAAYEDLLDFEIADYYDSRYNLKCGKRIKDILPYCDNEKIIKDINKINWQDDFDTFICGHAKELEKITKKQYLNDIILNCKLYGKQLYCFDNVLEIDPSFPIEKLFFPYIDETYMPQNRFGKLRVPSIPTLAVMGTSSKQGKMTVQLALRKILLQKGIKIGNIGTEPESPLFNFDFTFAYGYGASDNTTMAQMVQILNEMIFEIEKKGKDFVIAGSQSGTIPYCLNNLSMIPFKSYSFLLGVQPDSVILCVNAFDSIDYVKSTITFIESVVNTKVIAIILSNIKKDKVQNQFTDETFGIPIVNLDRNCGENLFNIISKYYQS